MLRYGQSTQGAGSAAGLGAAHPQGRAFSRSPAGGSRACLRRNHSALITGVVPGDYDGDSQMDVLLTYLPKNHVDGGLGAVIVWGKNQTLGELSWEFLPFIRG